MTPSEQLLGLVLVSFVLGLTVGSFLNVVIHRVPEGESVVRPRSRCPGCRTRIAAFDNVPVLSWLWLRGRCRHCGVGISARYPLMELLTGFVFAALAWRLGLHPLLPVMFAFASLLIAAAGIDFDHQFIPDGISVGGAALALLVVPLAKWSAGVPLLPAALASLAGAVLGAGMLWIVGFLHARVSATLGRTFPHWPGEGEELPTPGTLDYWTWFPGLGFGDVKLMALIGACLGPVGVICTIVLGALIGLLWGLAAAVSRGAANLPFGFGPSLALGAIATLLLPMELIRAFFP